MAARLNPRHSELVLARIRLSALVNRLQANSLGKLKREMTDGQIRAATFLCERLLAKAQAPIDLAVSGTIIVEERDPTQRPADYHRKRKVAAE